MFVLFEVQFDHVFQGSPATLTSVMLPPEPGTPNALLCKSTK